MFNRSSGLGLFFLCAMLIACNQATDQANRPGASPKAPPATVHSEVDTSKYVLGPELSPNGTAVSDDQKEGPGAGVYAGSYRAFVTPVASKTEPGVAGSGAYCLKIQTARTDRSGIRHPRERMTLKPNLRYLISCKIYSPKSMFRLGVKNDGASYLWASDLGSTDELDYANNDKAWTTFKGILTTPDNLKGLTELWIVHWEAGALTWYIDDLSIREVLKD